MLISLLGLRVGRLENWTRANAIYYAFVTATTVGYGDMRPSKGRSKVLAIVIAFCGLLFSGIVVSLAVNSATHTFKIMHADEIPALQQRMDTMENKYDGDK